VVLKLNGKLDNFKLFCGDKMKSWCLKDHLTGHIFKIFLSEEKFQKFLKENPDIGECIDCVECDDAPSIIIE
jgi:hypothetical protein